MIRTAFRVLAGSILLSLTFSAHSIPILELVVDNSTVTPELQGAKNVNVGGYWYDVNFMDGTCTGLFSGCDDDSDFFVDSQFDAVVASQALLDQVFLDGPLGAFDSDATLTKGCSGEYGCVAFTPAEVGSLTALGPITNPGEDGASFVEVPAAKGAVAENNFIQFVPNFPPTAVCTDVTCSNVIPVGSGGFPIFVPTAPRDGVSTDGIIEKDQNTADPFWESITFAVWNSSPHAIPEPSTLALFGLGLLGLGWSRSRRSS